LPHFLITVDVEDWFQVENFKPWIPFSVWDSLESRVEGNVNRLLDLFDSAGNVKATFFTLGWLAERMPHLVREIGARGHEVASHGYNHHMCNRLSILELKQDLADSKKRLEDLGGLAVQGFRAPSFSVNDEVLKIISESGYRYDSSYNSFALHGRYGRISLNGQRRTGIAYQLADNFFELPLSNLPILASGIFTRFKHFILPWGGGAYFRLMPLELFLWGVRSILKRDDAYLFYMHPWEVDPGQPRVQGAGIGRRIRHYANLAVTSRRLASMIARLGHCRFLTCRDYLDAHFLS
jgi:peptidoglycan-N-acetylglucosamine deacetylase